MKAKPRLVVLIVVLCGIGGFAVYRLMPKRFDGSSQEAFEASSNAIFEALSTDEQTSFREDSEDIGKLIAIENPKLAVAVVFGGRPETVEKVEAAIRKKLDGKTLAEFRALAAESRRLVADAGGLRAAVRQRENELEGAAEPEED